jgi:hypothetical protein
MPTRKQRRREAKQKRHEYEFVYLDEEGHELEEPPEELELERPAREEHRNGSRPAAKPRRAKAPAQRGGRPVRTPPEPSWQRAGKRALILGAVVFALFYLTGGKSGNRLLGALSLAAIYTALFIPFTYAIDRFAYNRFQRRQQGGGAQPRSGKKPTKR